MQYPEIEKQRIFDEICDVIINGKSLRTALKEVKLSSQTFFIWIRDSEKLSKQYAQATIERAELMFEDMFDIADEEAKLTKTKFGTTVDTGDVQHKRVRIDTRKWALSKMIPKKYGENPEDTTPKNKINSEKLRLIASVSSSIIPKHYKHFNTVNDWTLSEGGSRSGKTYNFLLWAYLQTLIGKFDLNIIAPSHKMLEHGSFSDIKKILSIFDPSIHIPLRPTKLDLYGSTWIFEVVTSENEAKRNRDNVFVNEADGISEVVANLLGRASGRKFIDFNPVNKFWASNKINEDESNILRSSWTDNQYLTENQLQWFAELKDKGEFAEDGSPESYAYQVYYLGKYSILSGKAYELTDFDLRDEVPEKFDYMISYSDPSLGVGSDYFASLLFGIKDKQVWAVDVIFSQFVKSGGFHEQLKLWDKQYGNIIDHYAEKNGTSGVVTKAVKEMYDGVLTEVANGDNKAADIIVYSTTAKKFKFKKSAKMIEFIKQCVDFPNNEHDDAPDCLARGSKILLKYFDL